MIITTYYRTLTTKTKTIMSHSQYYSELRRRESKRYTREIIARAAVVLLLASALIVSYLLGTSSIIV